MGSQRTALTLLQLFYRYLSGNNLKFLGNDFSNSNLKIKRLNHIVVFKTYRFYHNTTVEKYMKMTGGNSRKIKLPRLVRVSGYSKDRRYF